MSETESVDTIGRDETRGEGYGPIFDNVSDGLIVHEPDTDEIVDVNRQFAEMLGYTRAELRSKTVTEITADDWEPPVPARERVREAREAGQVRFEWCDEHRDGHRVWVDVSLSLVELDGVERVLASVRDVTERKRHRRRAEAIFDQTYQFTGLLEPDGTLLEANQTALEFADLDREDVVGKPFWECHWWQVDDATVERLQSAIRRAADGEFVRYEVEVQGRGGTEIIDFSIRPITDETGAVSLLVPEGRVITERRARRERLDVFNRVLRHNLRNELSVVTGCAEEIKTRVTDETVRDLADKIVDGGRRLVELGETTRRFDELEEDGSDFESVPVRGYLRRVAWTVESDHSDASVRLDLSDDTLTTKPPFLRTALEHLVENAVEHGEPPVELASRRSDDGETVLIRISDDGPGIPRSEVAAVRGDARDQLTHGSGIGLWIVERSLDAVGADWSVDTTDGTTVQIHHPVDPSS